MPSSSSLPWPVAAGLSLLVAAAIACGSEGDSATTAPEPASSPSDGAAPDGGQEDSAPPSRDSGPSILRAGDVLVVESRNRGSDVQLLSDTKVCFFPKLVHADGTRTAVRASAGLVTVAAANSSVVMGAPLVDCPTGGVVGVRPGVTTLSVTFASGGQSVSAPAVVTVQPGELTFGRRPDVPAGFSVPLAASATMTARMLSHEGQRGSYDDLLLAYGVAAPASVPRDAELVGSWLDLTSAAAVSVSRVAGDDGDAWRLRTGAPASTTLTARYRAPSGTLSVDVPAHLFAFNLAAMTPQSLYIVLTKVDDGSILDRGATLEPGSCVVPLLGGIAQGADASDQAPVDLLEGTTWSTSVTGGATASPSSHGELCVGGTGVVTIHGCTSAGACTDASVYVGAGATKDLALTLLDSSPVGGTQTGFGYRVCPPLRAQLGAGATAVDVTKLATWDLRSKTDNNLQFTPDTTTGAPVFDFAGNPCFLLYDAAHGAQHPTLAGPGTSTVQATVGYAGATATPLAVSLRGTWVASPTP